MVSPPPLPSAQRPYLADPSWALAPFSLRSHQPRSPAATPARPSLLYWPAIAAAGTFALLVIASALFLVASTSRAAPISQPGVEPTQVAQVVPPVEVPPVVVPVDEPPRPVPVIEPIEILHAPQAVPAKSACSTGTCAASKTPAPAASEERFQRHGTAVDFARSPDLADDLARSARKLRFVLHLSGHLEEAGFT